MSGFFEALLNMSITGSVVIAVIILVRFLLKGMPKRYSYMLWAIAGFRLCCPFSFRSVVSIFNFNPIQQPDKIITSSGTMNYISTPVPSISQAVTNEADNAAIAPVTSNSFDSFIDLLPYIWFGVFVAFVCYAVISFIKMKKNLATSTKYEGNIYQSGAISSPFILGIIKPKIYIPYNIESEYIDYVIAHERYHIKRFDNISKAVAFLLLTLHWFNPICWLAFFLFNKDMEMSCDEWVLSHNDNIKKQYSNALLSFATNKSFPAPSPLCFGEASAKSRIKNILKFRKPTAVISVLAAAICIVIAVVCIANPSSNDNSAVKNNTENTDYYEEDETAVLFMNMAESSKRNDYSDIIADISSGNSTNEYYKALMKNKDKTIRYIFDKFSSGRRVNSDGTLMRIVMDNIIGNEAIGTDCDTGQEYFDLWAEHYLELSKEKGIDHIKSNYPYAYIYLTEYADSSVNQKPVEYLSFYAYGNYEYELNGDRITFRYNNYDGQTKEKIRWQQNYFDPQAVSAELVSEMNGKEIYRKSLEIKDLRAHSYNNDAWDYMIEIDPEITIRLNSKPSYVPELFVKITDSNSVEYKINIRTTVFNDGMAIVNIHDSNKNTQYVQSIDNSAYDTYGFILNSCWYNMHNENDETTVYCSQYNIYGQCSTTIYTRSKSGKWSVKTEADFYSIDENDTINHYKSDRDYSRAWWHINTESKCIEELDKNTSEVIQTLVPRERNDLQTAKEFVKQK